jgi:hypothetical protein
MYFREVKKNNATIFLLLTLLFSQVAVNFFHTDHTEHTLIKQIPTSQDTLSPHGEHCDVCAVDFLHGLVFQENQTFFFAAHSSNAVISFASSFSEIDLTLSSSRAPPLPIR